MCNEKKNRGVISLREEANSILDSLTTEQLIYVTGILRNASYLMADAELTARKKEKEKNYRTFFEFSRKRILSRNNRDSTQGSHIVTIRKRVPKK